MNQTTNRTMTGLALVCCATLTQTLRAGGISLYAIATPDLGHASPDVSLPRRSGFQKYPPNTGLGPGLSAGLP